MSILRLFDASQYISAGNISKRYMSNGVIEVNGRFKTNEMPCGGIRFLLNPIMEYADEDTDLVFVFDRPPTIKREIYKNTFGQEFGYKGNRPKKDPSIIYQRQYAEEIIKQIGYQAVAAEGYEADDCIATIVEMYKDYYDKIYVHSLDSDLFYLVSDNVEIRTVGERGKTVNLTNWETTVKSGYVVPFNTLLLDKLLTGERGDNIPRVSDSMGDKILAYIKEDMYPMCKDTGILRKWVSIATDNDPTVMGTLDLLIPLTVPSEFVELYDQEVNKDALDYYLYVTGNKYNKRKYAPCYPLGEDTIRQCLDEYNRR